MGNKSKFHDKIKELINNSEFLGYFHDTIEINYTIFFIVFSIIWKVENPDEKLEKIDFAYPVKGKYFSYDFEIVSYLVEHEDEYGNVIFINKDGEKTSMEMISGIYLMEAVLSVLCTYENGREEFILKNIEANVDNYLKSRQHAHDHDCCSCGHDHDGDHHHDGECCGNHHGHDHNREG